MELLTEIFARMDQQATIFDDAQEPVHVLTTTEERAGMTLCVAPGVFSSLDEARIHLDKLQNWMASRFELQMSALLCIFI